MTQSDTLTYATAMNHAGSKRSPRRRNYRLWVLIGSLAVASMVVVYPVVRYVLGGGIYHTAEGEVVDLKQLGNFVIDEKTGTMNDVPARFRALDGKKVILEGFMYNANAAADEVNRFQFVYSISNCCFGGPPKPQERVFVNVPGERMVPYYANTRCCRIVGTLHVKVVTDRVPVPSGGSAVSVVSVYTLDLDKAEPL